MPDRAALRARIQALADAGKSTEEIRAIVRQGLGPTPAPPYSIARDMPGGSAPPEDNEPGVTSTGDGPMFSPLDAIMGAAKWGAGKVGQAKEAAGRAVLQGLTGDKGVADAEATARRLRTDPSMAGLKEISDFQQEVPGQVAGMLVGGGAGKAASTALGGAGKGLGAIAADMLGGGLGAATGQVATDVVSGNPEGMEGRALRSGAFGAGLSGVTSALGRAAGGVGDAVVNSKGGQARQLIESEGGNVGPLSSGDNGPFAPGGRLAGRKPTDRDIGAVSRESTVNVLKRIDETREAETAPFRDQKAGLRSGEQAVETVDPIVDEVRALAKSQRLSPGQRQTARGWLADLEKWGQDAEGGGKTGPYLMPAAELEDFRGMISDQLALDPTSVPQKLQGRVGALVKGAVDQTAFGPPNKGISEAATRAEAQRRLLGLKDQPSGEGVMSPEGLPATDVNRVTNMMARQGQNTVTAGGQNTAVEEGGLEGPVARERLDQLAEQYPQHKSDVRMPQVLAAKGDLDFSLLGKGDKGGLIQRLASKGGPLAGAVTAASVGAGSGHPVLGALLAAGGLGAMNAAPIAGRLLYTPARAAAALGRGASELAPEIGGGAGALDPLQALLDQMEATKKKGKRK